MTLAYFNLSLNQDGTVNQASGYDVKGSTEAAVKVSLNTLDRLILKNAALLQTPLSLPSKIDRERIMSRL